MDIHKYPMSEQAKGKYQCELLIKLENGGLIVRRIQSLTMLNPINEINGYVDAYTVQADVCAEKLRE